MLGLQPQQLQWQSEVIVEIAFRLEDAKAGREHVRDRFLGRRLTGRTGDGNERLAPYAPHASAELLQGGERVVYQQ